MSSARQTRGGTRPIVISVFVRRNEWDDDYEAHALDKGKINVCVSRATEEQIIFAEHWGRRPWDPLHKMMDHAWNHRNEDGHEYFCLDDLDDGSPARRERFYEAMDWIHRAGWENHMQFDSDDEDPSTVEFFANTDRLWQACQTVREHQTRSWDIPRYEAVTEVSDQLWGHVKRLVVCATVNADFQEQKPSEGLDEEGACA